MKPTFTGLGLSFHSFCSFGFKLNSISTLINRTYKISSNMTNLCKEFSFLAEYFYSNGYSKKLVFSKIRKFISSLQYPYEKPSTVEKKDIYLSIPYFGPVTDVLKADLNKVMFRHFPYIKLNLVFTNKLTIGSLFRFKDVLPVFLRTSCVYHYSCLHANQVLM